MIKGGIKRPNCAIKLFFSAFSHALHIILHSHVLFQSNFAKMLQKHFTHVTKLSPLYHSFFVVTLDNDAPVIKKLAYCDALCVLHSKSKNTFAKKG